MSVDLQPLQELFAETDGALRWSEVEPCLQFWVDVARGETTLLKPQSEIDEGVYCAAVETATRCKVTDIVFASATRRPPPSWTN